MRTVSYSAEILELGSRATDRSKPIHLYLIERKRLLMKTNFEILHTLFPSGIRPDSGFNLEDAPIKYPSWHILFTDEIVSRWKI